MLNEYTYGDLKANGEKLLELTKGDFLFFHKTIYDKRYITPYYFVEEVQQAKNDIKDPLIKEKYNNYHLQKDKNQLDINEAIVFGMGLKD